MCVRACMRACVCACDVVCVFVCGVCVHMVLFVFVIYCMHVALTCIPLSLHVLCMVQEYTVL